MTTRDTTDVLGGLAELLAMALFAAARRSLEKHTFFTKVGDQICAVGYYK